MARDYDNENTRTDQIRSLENKVRLAGKLAEISEMRSGETNNGIPYVSFDGAIQCGPSADYVVKFRTFVKSKKSDGTDSKNFTAVKKWYNEAVSIAQDKDNATMVEMFGSVTDNPYVNIEGKLIEGTQFSIQAFRKFEDYAADIDIEGFIQGVTDETKGIDNPEPTGRQKLRLISRDIFGNFLDFKNLIVTEDLVDALNDNGYERGATAKFFISLIPTEAKAAAPKAGGIGKQRTTSGYSHLEWVIVGADPVIDADSDKALDRHLIKDGMSVRAAHLKEVEDKGYLGGTSNSSKSSSDTKTSGATKSSGRSGIGKKKDDMEELPDILDDDDMPF